MDIGGSEQDVAVMKRKIYVGTYHSVKGLERKVVIVLGMDASYLDIYCRDHPNPNTVPNPVFVALTRCKERLSIFHHYQHDFFPFIRQDRLNNVFQVVWKMDIQVKERWRPPIKMETISVTEKIRNLNAEKSREILRGFTRSEIQKQGGSHRKIGFNNVSSQPHGLSENVADLNGVVIPMIFSDGLPHPLVISEALIQDYLRKALAQWTSRTGYYFRKSQVTCLNWMTPQNVRMCMRRLRTLLDTIGCDIQHQDHHQDNQTISFEHHIEHTIGNRILRGCIDLYCEKLQILVEFKLTTSLMTEHFLQTAIYGSILYLRDHPEYLGGVVPPADMPRMYLFNISTNELMRVWVSDPSEVIRIAFLETDSQPAHDHALNDFVQMQKLYYLSSTG
jgi:hypothetical protein